MARELEIPKPIPVNGVNDYSKYKQLADNPIMMAMKILELENNFKVYHITNDLNRKNALKVRLEACIKLSETDIEAAHSDADDLLLEIINDEDISELYGKVKKWYS